MPQEDVGDADVDLRLRLRAHFNPALTLADASQGGIRGREVPGYIAAQAVGALLSVWAAHLMCDEAVIQVSQHVRAVAAQMFTEFVATFGLLSVIWGCGRLRATAVRFAVGLYITGPIGSRRRRHPQTLL